jgi:hypothetical protein
MMQQGRVFALATRGRDGKRHWAFRYRTAGRASKRVQRGGFRSEEDARAALARALEKLRRERGWRGGPTSPSSRSPADNLRPVGRRDGFANYRLVLAEEIQELFPAAALTAHVPRDRHSRSRRA